MSTPDVHMIFLARQDEYTLDEAARLTGIPRNILVAQILDGTIKAHYARRTYTFTWPQLVDVLLQRHGIAWVQHALGDAAGILPPLVQVRPVHLVLPAYQAEMLITLAQRATLSVDAYLANHLLDLAAAEAPTLEDAIPGFTSAMHYPHT